MTYPAPHRPFAPAIISADFKTYPADFIVKELMDVDFSGQGEHLWVHVCKVGMNTAFVAKLLANWANISIRDVGYSGLKDRHAQTYQWFSLRLPKRGLPTTDFDEFIKEYLKEGECLTLIAHHWHDKKTTPWHAQGKCLYHHAKASNRRDIRHQCTACSCWADGCTKLCWQTTLWA